MFLAFAVLMILSFVVSMVALPSTNAAEIKTFPYVEAVPAKVGLEQPVLINVGLMNALNAVADGWNLTLTIVDPNGKAETREVKTWSTGMAGVHYTPQIEGTYTISAVFHETEYRNNLFLGSKTSEATFEVEAGYWKPNYPGHAMPSEYWTRPVDAQLREWWSIMGSWLIQGPRNTRRNNQFAPYNDAPESAHVLWSMPDDQYPGGLSGMFDSISFQHGDAYEGKFYGAIIIAGVLYYNVAPVYNGGANGHDQTVRAVDLHTGKILWEKNLVKEGFAPTVRLTHGQVLSYFNENNRGTWAYLWLRDGQYGTTWYAVNPQNGNLIFNITNVPSIGTASATLNSFEYGPNGEMLIYNIINNATGSYLRQWNSTRCVAGNNGNWGSTSNTAAGRTFNGSRDACYDWVIQLPRNFGNPIKVFPGDRAIFANVTAAGVTLSAVHLDATNLGRMMYTDVFWSASSSDWTYLSAVADTSGQNGWAAFSDDPYVAVYWVKDQAVNYVFDLNTGSFMWKSEPQHLMDGLGGANSNSAPEKVIAYGYLISGSLGGIVYCYDVRTGELRWTYAARDPYVGESYLTENWWLTLCFVSDGKVYFGHHEHSANVPLPRGAPFFALDVETGEEVWRIDGAFRQHAWGGRAIIGDSIIVTLDTYDSQIYAIGKGPSETTVAVSTPVTNAGNTVLITGTVMDISPGTASDNLKARFPKGVPAMSDASMSDWMLHVYKQFEAPTDVTGVEVDIYAYDGVDSILVDTVTSDAYGNFYTTWAPDTEGEYVIWASFAGSASYYHSDAQTTMAVLAAETSENGTPYEWYIIGVGIAIIAVVVIFGLLILFKKK